MIWIFAAMIFGLLWLTDRPSIEISWRTETEFNSIGFNILRGEEEQGPFVRTNDELIPASEDAAAGADYTYLDTDVVGGRWYYYQLEDVDLRGNTTRHMPISFEAPERPVWMLALSLVAIAVGLILTVSAKNNQLRDN